MPRKGKSVDFNIQRAAAFQPQINSYHLQSPQPARQLRLPGRQAHRAAVRGRRHQAAQDGEGERHGAVHAGLPERAGALGRPVGIGVPPRGAGVQPERGHEQHGLRLALRVRDKRSPR